MDAETVNDMIVKDCIKQQIVDSMYKKNAKYFFKKKCLFRIESKYSHTEM